MTSPYSALHNPEASADMRASAKLWTMDRSRSGSASARYLRSSSAAPIVLVTSTASSPSCSLVRNLKIDAVVVASGGWSAQGELTGARGVHHVCGREPAGSQIRRRCIGRQSGDKAEWPKLRTRNANAD